MMHDNNNQELMNKLKSFFNKKFNLILLIVLALAFFIRLKYMNVNAALWWDEADYMTLAKHYGLGLPEQAAPWRARALSMVLGIFYYLGANELFMHFLWALFSLGAVYFTYKLGKLFYNRTIGLLAAIGFGVYFEYLFWTARFSLGVFSTFLWVIIIYLFWSGYVVKKKPKYLAIAGGLLGFGIFAYESTTFLVLVIALYLLLTEKLSFIKKKEIWYAVAMMVIVMLPFLVYNQVHLGHFYPRLAQQSHLYSTSFKENELSRPSNEIFKDMLAYPKSFPYMLKWPFFIVFLFGLIKFVDLFLGFDLLLKKKASKMLKTDLFVFIWPLIVLILFSVIYATSSWGYALRFLFPMMPAVFIIVALGFTKVYNLLSKFNIGLAIGVVVLLLVWGIYSQLTFANQLISFKKDTYAQQKEAGLWLKEQTQPEEVIVGCGMAVPFIYYTEREFISSGSNITNLEYLIEKYNPRFILMDGFDPGCVSVLNYPIQHKDKFKLVNLFFLDKENTKPIIAIFQPIKD